jgi:tRNA(Arg) A34 adenosine deaminase TadA
MFTINNLLITLRFILVCVRVEHLPENAYLCSGLDLYLQQEPDLMASMALVHSRIRRVFYRHSDAAHGALGSGRGHIHCLRELNHHYRVFQIDVTDT